ncbi:MAG: helix-turn-helix domain-containing protein [Alphaproteobacteria bacterium]|nr:helix-turn-helix domain-containing protein [Alphaproteobacteria bacterium]
MDRRDLVRVFRQRLAEALALAQESQGSLAKRVGIDRSTLAQLLSPENERLPRADTVAALAEGLKVKSDWLLGLVQDQGQSTDILERSIDIERLERFPYDDAIARWHDESAGYKVRYVPTNLPDMLKTDALIRYEYQSYAAMTTDRALDLSHHKLTYALLPETDIEVCSSEQSVRDLALGTGLWRGLSADDRREQLHRMADLTEQLYPTFRWFLFNGLNHYSAPVTIFGPKRAAVYIGQMYFAFTGTEHIRTLSKHFDTLVRAAILSPTEMPGHLRDLAAQVRQV